MRLVRAGAPRDCNRHLGRPFEHPSEWRFRFRSRSSVSNSFATMDTRLEQDGRPVVRIEGQPAELPRLRAGLSDWLADIGLVDPSRKDLVLAAHEVAAEAIEREAADVAVLGAVVGDAIRLLVVGGDCSSLGDMRSPV